MKDQQLFYHCTKNVIERKVHSVKNKTKKETQTEKWELTQARLRDEADKKEAEQKVKTEEREETKQERLRRLFVNKDNPSIVHKRQERGAHGGERCGVIVRDGEVVAYIR